MAAIRCSLAPRRSRPAICEKPVNQKPIPIAFLLRGGLTVVENTVEIYVLAGIEDSRPAQQLAQALRQDGIVASLLDNGLCEPQSGRKHVYAVLLSESSAEDSEFMLRVASAIQAAATHWNAQIISILLRGETPALGLLALYPSFTWVDFDHEDVAHTLESEVEGMQWEKPQETRDWRWRLLEVDAEDLRSREIAHSAGMGNQHGPMIATGVGFLTLVALAMVLPLATESLTSHLNNLLAAAGATMAGTALYLSVRLLESTLLPWMSSYRRVSPPQRKKRSRG